MRPALLWTYLCSPWLAGLPLYAACRSAPIAAPLVLVPPSTSGAQVERINVEATPWELFFSGVRGQARGSESISARNKGSEPITFVGVAVQGENAASFSLVDVPPLPKVVSPNSGLNVTLAFNPKGDAALGVHRAVVVFSPQGSTAGGVIVDVRGLVTRGLEGDNEPPLFQVTEALGYGIDVGGKDLSLGSGEAPLGAEVRAPRFVRAKPGTVGLYAVARYSPDEPIAFGFYESAEKDPKRRVLAVIAQGQHQTLNPDLEPEGKTSFDPGDAPFGLFTTSRTHSTFTEDARNTGPTRHAVRVYPIRTAANQPVVGNYLVCFEEAKNGDYNDFVFVLQNVKPVP